MEYKTKYHSTGQLRNAIRHLCTTLTFVGMDDEGNPKYDQSRLKPIELIGTVKLHGTNASVVLHECGNITFHSKEQQLATLTAEDEFTLLSDNAEFAQTMRRRWVALRGLLGEVVTKLADLGELAFPVKVSGEWCGAGIQRGVGISHSPLKRFFAFGVKAGDKWLPSELFTHGWDDAVGLHNIAAYPVFSVTVDPTFPERAVLEMEKLVNQVEECCPVAKALQQQGLLDEEATELIGEGIVWTPSDATLFTDTGTWFKTKGQKHSVSKVKKIVSLDPEKVESIDSFVQYAITEARLEQGLQEVGLDQTLIGKFIGWVNQDINKEEGDVLEANGLSMKDVGKYLSNQARSWYLSKL